MKTVHKAGDHRFHDRDPAGERSEEHHGKEHGTYHIAGRSHGGKYLRQRYKHERRSGCHSFRSHKHIDRRDDHDAGQQRHHRIEDLDVINGPPQIGAVRNIRAIGDHDTHSDAEAVEQLHQRIHDDVEELLQVNAFKTGDQINLQSVHAGYDLTAVTRPLQRQGIDGDPNDQQDQNGHQDLGRAFDAAGNTIENDKSAECQEDHQKQDRFIIARDESGKIPVLCRFQSVTADKGHEIFDHPAADGAVIWHDQEGDQAGENADPTPVFIQLPVGGQRALPGLAADGDFAGQHGETEGERQNDINHQEQSPAVPGCQIREPPDIAQTYGAASCGHDESQ